MSTPIFNSVEAASRQYVDQQIALIKSMIITTSGNNFRINQATGNFEFKNLTTGEYNALNTEGASGSESIVIQTQEP